MVLKRSNIAIVLLTRYPNNIWLNFLNNFYDYDIFVVIDDNNKDFCKLFDKANSKINFIQIDDKYCKERGYHNALIRTSNVPNKVLAWDKALLYFCLINTNYEHIWLIEDDVFFLKESVIKNIDNHYTNSDLLTPSHEMNTSGNTNGHETGWPHWHCVKDRLNTPWAHSMVCMCRLSNRLLNDIKKYVDNHKILVYHEIMFNTIACHNNYKVDTPNELSRIHYNTKWNIDDIDIYYCYHPLKNLEEQLKIKQKNMIYYDNLFNNINYNEAKRFIFNECDFLRRHLPEGFDFNVYLNKNYSNMKDNSENSIIWDWFYWGKYENKIYKV